MRLGILLLILSVLCPASVWAEEVVVGTIVSIDAEGKTFAIQPVGSTSKADILTVEIPPEGLPAFASPGKTLRIWGNQSRVSGKRFIPSHFSGGDPQRPMKDPTGVRKRLRRRPPPPAVRPGRGGRR